MSTGTTKQGSSAMRKPSTLDDLNNEPRWVAWAEETRRGRRVKVPKCPVTGRNADCTGSPDDWGTSREAERRRRQQGNHGIGIVLGAIRPGLNLVGIDLDGCRDATGAIVGEAREVIERFNTYSEVSPSDRGVKLFFLASAAHVAEVRRTYAIDKRKIFGAGEHHEIALDFGRYYTVTGKRLPELGDELRVVSLDELKWLLDDLGPRFLAAHKDIDGPNQTGSGFGYRFFQERRAQGDSYEKARAAILNHKGRAGDWARRVDERQLQRAWGADPKSAKRDGPLDTVLASQVKMQRIKWLWPGRFAYGKVALLVGDPDVGKSLAGLDIVARVSRGDKWPDGSEAPSCRAIILSAEDDAADTLVPRLAAAGANLDRVEIIGMKRIEGQEYMFSLAEDLAKLEREIVRWGDVGVVLIDPVTAYMGVKKIDSYRTTDVRGVIAPFAAMTARTQTAGILISHFNKNISASAINRITDSLAFVASARHCYACIPDENSDRILFLRVKNNLAPRDENQGLAYSFEEKLLDNGIRAPRVVWHDDPINISANEALAALRRSGGRPDSARQVAMEIIKTMLADGKEVEASEIEQAAEKRSVSVRTLQRVAEDLGIIKSGAKGREGKSIWRLPNND